MSREMHVHASPSAFACASGHSPAREIVQFGMAEQDLHGPQVLRAFIDQRGLSSPHRVRAIDRRIEADGGNPLMNDPGILPRRNMW